MAQICKQMYSSNKMDWGTPQWLYDQLDAEFHFNLDAAASDENHKCKNYYTSYEDGLNSPWSSSTFCNPPYGRAVGSWVHKAYRESLKGNTVVMLLFARTDTSWFHDLVYGKAEIRFLRGRIKFDGAKYNAPFPSMVVIYRGQTQKGNKVMTNREKIRSMTDEELIENILCSSYTCPPDRDFWDCEIPCGCVNCWKEWLNREAVTES